MFDNILIQDFSYQNETKANQKKRKTKKKKTQRKQAVSEKSGVGNRNLWSNDNLSRFLEHEDLLREHVKRLNLHYGWTRPKDFPIYIVSVWSPPLL